MTAKKPAKKKSTKKPAGMFLEFEGSVAIVDRDKNGKEERSEIEGEVILQLVLHALKAGVRSQEEKSASSA